MIGSDIKEDIEDDEDDEDDEDVILWPDGYLCFRFELEEHTHRSSNYKVYFKNNPDHEQKYKKYKKYIEFL